MRCGIPRSGAGPVSIAVLSLLHHLPDLRRRSDFPCPVCGRVYRPAVWRVHRDPYFPAPPARRPRLGLEQRLFRLGANSENRIMSDNQIDEGLRSELQKRGVWVTSTQELYNWGRRNSIWPLQFGLACCAIEMIATAASRYDLARFGGEVFRPSPRQADLLIVAGTVTKKMAPQVVRLYNQMPDPKYVIAMGACAISGGPFKQGYNVLKGIDRYIPVDVYIPGCPPRPEALLHAFMELQRKIDGQNLTGADQADHLRPLQASEFPVPAFGEHDLQPPANPALFRPPLVERQ